MRMSNTERAARARHALQSYQNLVGEVDPTFENTVADLLADIHHFCDDRHLDFDALSGTAGDYFRAENQPEAN